MKRKINPSSRNKKTWKPTQKEKDKKGGKSSYWKIEQNPELKDKNFDLIMDEDL